MNDGDIGDRAAGGAAIVAGLSWVTWAVVNGLTHGGLENGIQSGSARPTLFGPLLTAAWNLLLVPAALTLGRRLQHANPGIVPVFTASGILSLAFWAFGGVTRITPALEVTYLALSAVWWLGIGIMLRRSRRALGLFTIVVGAFAALDTMLCLLEPLPSAMFALAAPKLPLAACWSIVVGVVLCREKVLARVVGSDRELQPTPTPQTASE